MSMTVHEAGSCNVTTPVDDDVSILVLSKLVGLAHSLNRSIFNGDGSIGDNPPPVVYGYPIPEVPDEDAIGSHGRFRCGSTGGPSILFPFWSQGRRTGSSWSHGDSTPQDWYPDFHVATLCWRN